MARLIRDSTGEAPRSTRPVPEKSIATDDWVEINAIDVRLGGVDVGPVGVGDDAGGFGTDSAISRGRGAQSGRQLQRWAPDVGDEGLMHLEDSVSSHQRGWDQFALNEQKFGVRTDYHEELYTTTLDPTNSKFSMEDAARLAAEIERGNKSTSNIHLLEERGIEIDDSELDEEARYGAVIRDDQPPPGMPIPAGRGGSASTIPPPAPPPRPAGAWGRGAPTASAPISIDARKETNKVRAQIGGKAASPYGTPKQLSSPLVGDAQKIAALNLDPGVAKVDEATRRDFEAFKVQQQQQQQQQQRSGRNTISELKQFSESVGTKLQKTLSGPSSAGSGSNPSPFAAAAAADSTAAPPPPTSTTAPTTTTSTPSPAPETSSTPSSTTTKKSGLNPNAKEFTLNFNAKAFTPSFTPAAAKPATTTTPSSMATATATTPTSTATTTTTTTATPMGAGGSSTIRSTVHRPSFTTTPPGDGAMMGGPPHPNPNPNHHQYATHLHQQQQHQQQQQQYRGGPPPPKRGDMSTLQEQQAQQQQQQQDMYAGAEYARNRNRHHDGMRPSPPYPAMDGGPPQQPPPHHHAHGHGHTHTPPGGALARSPPTGGMHMAHIPAGMVPLGIATHGPGGPMMMGYLPGPGGMHMMAAPGGVGPRPVFMTTPYGMPTGGHGGMQGMAPMQGGGGGGYVPMVAAPYGGPRGPPGPAGGGYTPQPPPRGEE